MVDTIVVEVAAAAMVVQVTEGIKRNQSIQFGAPRLGSPERGQPDLFRFPRFLRGAESMVMEFHGNVQGEVRV